MKLATARKISNALVMEFLPAVERISIAGSIRRQKDEVGDIELVAIPQYAALDEQLGLFEPGGRLTLRNLLWERLEELSEEHTRIIPIKPGVQGIEPDANWAAKRTSESRYFRLWLPRPKTKVDLFIASPETWGAILAIRTGSARFSQALVTRWTAVSGGGHVKKGLLHRPDGEVVSTSEEEHVFAACKLDWIKPELRT